MKIQYILFAAFLVITSCKEKEEVKNESISSIQKEQGIPVRVEAVKTDTIQDMRKFSGDLKGGLQKVVYPGIAERVAKLRVQVGEKVRKGQVVMEMDVAGNTPQYRQVKAQFELAQATKERMEKTLAEGGISQQQFDEVEMNYKLAAANYDAVRKITFIQSPITGVLSEIFLREGEVALVGQNAPPIFQVDFIDRVTLSIPVSAQEIHLFKTKQKATIYLADNAIDGWVSKVPMAASARSRMFYVEIDFPNMDHILRPGMFLQCQVEVNEEIGLSISTESLLEENGEYYVMLAQNGMAHKQKVFPGLQDDKRVLIEKGLKADDQVITQGASKLRQDTKINIVP